MYYITIVDKETNREWQENYDSPYLLNKRLNKLKYSKRLVVRTTIKI